MQTIKVILAESGRVANLKKDFPLYVGSYQNKLLNVLVPKSILAPNFISHYIDSDGVVKTADGSYTAIKVGMTYLKRTGAIKESSTFFMRYLKDVTVNNIQYSMYERPLPKEFTLFEGQGENAPRLIVNVVNVLVKTTTNAYGEDTPETTDDVTFKYKSTTLEIITSQYAAIDVMYSADLENEPELNPTDLELLSAEVNKIVEELPNKTNAKSTIQTVGLLEESDIIYSFLLNGFKQPNILYRDVEYTIKTSINGQEELKKGAVIVTNQYQDKDYIYQNEIFFYDKGVVTRKIIFNATNYDVIEVGDWQTKVDEQQEISDAGKFLYIDENGKVNLTSAIKDFIVRLGSNMVTDKASAFNFSTDFDVIAEARAENTNLENVNISLSPNFKERVTNLETDNNSNKKSIQEHQEEINDNVAYDIVSSIDNSSYVMSLSLKNKKGVVVSSTHIDLPLETMVIGASYENKTLTLTLKNGQKVNIDISALISGLVPDSRLINSKALNEDIVLTAADIGTYSKQEINVRLSSKTNDTDLAAVAKTGNYNDLNNTPTIPDGVEVIDNLTSTSTTASLSANQGRVLKAEIDKKQDKMTVDTALSTTSTNTVQNKVVTAELNKKLNLSGGTITGDLSVNGQVKFPNDVPTDNDSSWVFVCKNGSAKNGFAATTITNLGSKITASKVANKLTFQSALNATDTFDGSSAKTLVGKVVDMFTNQTVSGTKTFKNNVIVKKGSDWSQFQATSKSGYYRAFESDDSRVRIDVRDTTNTSDRRYIDIYSGSAVADNDDAIHIVRNNSTAGTSSTKVATQNWVNKVSQMTKGNAASTGQHDTVKEFWINSAGTEWYRIWRSGWKEWGMVLSNGSNTDSLSVTFSNNFKFSTDNYVIQTNMRGGTVTGGTADTTLAVRAAGLVNAQTITGFTLQALARNYMLYACGL